MIKLILLDFDGTILDTRDAVVRAVLLAAKQKGYDFDKEKVFSAIGEKKEGLFKRLGVKQKDINPIVLKFWNNLKYFEEGFCPRPCYPIGPLRDLSKEVPLIIVSNASTKRIVRLLKKVKLYKNFKKIIGADMFTTKDGMIKELIKKYKLSKEEVIYVGDRFSDVKYAKKVGCISIAIQSKCAWSSLKEIKKERPDYIIKDFSELKKLVDKL